MPLEKKPFRSYTIDSERETPKRDIFSISLNPKERALLNTFKQQTNIPYDSKAYKLLAEIGANVINSIFGEKIIKYLSSKDRFRTGE